MKVITAAGSSPRAGACVQMLENIGERFDYNIAYDLHALPADLVERILVGVPVRVIRAVIKIDYVDNRYALPS